MSFARVQTISFLLAALATSGLYGQGTRDFANKVIPHEEGFRVYFVTDMEGMGSVVNVGEIIAGTEGERYSTLSTDDYWDHYRHLLTEEANAAISGARAGGAESFVVNEGHGGNRFANILPWELDPDAILIRGYPKPIVMATGINGSFGTMIFTGAHANAGSPGVMSHNFAFDHFTVNGKVLNEVGINALIAGEMGVSVSMVSGDDVLVAETLDILDNGAIGVVVKIAVGRNAAITYSPEKVRQMIRDGAEEAVRREIRGDFRPLVLDKPYDVEFTLRATYPEDLIAPVDTITSFDLISRGNRSYRFTTNDAKEIGFLLDTIESIVLP